MSAPRAIGSQPEQRTPGPLASSLLGAGLCLVLIGERVLVEGEGLVSYVGLAAIALAFALRLRALSAARSIGREEVRGVERRLLLCYLGVAFALGLYFLSTDKGIALLSLADEARARAEGALTAGYMAALLISLTALLFTTRTVGWVYLGESLLLGGVFIAYAAALLRDPSRANASRLYRYSLLYLALLFVVIMVESVVML